MYVPVDSMHRPSAQVPAPYASTGTFTLLLLGALRASRWICRIGKNTKRPKNGCHKRAYMELVSRNEASFEACECRAVLDKGMLRKGKSTRLVFGLKSFY